jgi:hypothetical protein
MGKAIVRCTKCSTELIPGSKFCHRCGERVMEQVKSCPLCRAENPLAAIFCHECGFHFSVAEPRQGAYTPRYILDFVPERMRPQLKALFFRLLLQRIREEHDGRKHDQYVQRFYDSRFATIFEARTEQLSRDVMTLWERSGQSALPEIDRFLEDAFEGLLDYFIIEFCPDLNEVWLPGAMLRYERLSAENTDLRRMIFDFLDFPHEPEVCYTHFVQMPQALLANACKRFLHAEKDEQVFFICDLSLKGTCKEGFAMTDRTLYWRAPLDGARKAAYDGLFELRFAREWLLINGHFFTANPSLNLKLYKLLKKLQRWKTPVSRSDRRA